METAEKIGSPKTDATPSERDFAAQLDVYRGLAEELLQQGTSEEAYALLLERLSTCISAEKFGVVVPSDDLEHAKLVALKGKPKEQKFVGKPFPVKGTPFERSPDDIRQGVVHESGSVSFPPFRGETMELAGPFLTSGLVYRKPKEEPRSVGCLFVSQPRNGGFTAVDANTISTFASLASITKKHFENIETASTATKEMDLMLKDLMATFESLQQYSAIVEQVNRISVRINSTLELKVIFSSIADYTRNLLSADIAVVAVMGGNSKINFPGVAGLEPGKLPLSVILDKESILSIVMGSEKPIVNNQMNKFVSLGFEFPVALRNFATYPIESKGKIVAVIMVFNKTNGADFTSSDTDFLKTLAYQASTAIENARLLNNLQDTQFTMMGKLSELAEKRDPETGEHLLRMQKYSRIIAQEMAKFPKFAGIIDEQFISAIYIASPLHDIGKVGIPDNVLLKPGKHEPEEFEIMKTHASIGETILQGPEYLKMACDIAGYHHEKFDGTGYPHKTKGEEIPLAARIVAVADVYDALTSKRVYKEGKSHEVAMEIIREGIGEHFDPEVVTGMEAGIKEIITIKNLVR